MSSFTSFALQTLLEPTRFASSTTTTTTTTNNNNNQTHSTDSKSEPAFNNNKSKNSNPPAPLSNHIYITSPALYTTPEPKPIPPEASAAQSPSPYVFNRKRRDLQSSVPEGSVNHRVDGFEIQGDLAAEPSQQSSSPPNRGDDAREEWSSEACSDGGVLYVKLPEAEEEGEGSDEDFAEACEARSVASSSDFTKQTVMSPRSVVFFDADEEFFSDGSVSNISLSHISTIESELRTTRLALLDEIERRKAAEDAVNRMCSQWQRIGRKLAESGLTFPTPLPASNSLDEIDPIEQLLQELVVTRFVSEAVGMAQGRCEAEFAAAAIIESKDQEISRLRDRLQYYETVNQEMSQRNLEVAETARRHREKWNQQKWIWGCIGLSIAIGASVIACSYSPTTSTDLLATTSDSDASPTSSPESA